MTHCTSCGTENSDATQYCVKCGSPLTAGSQPAPPSGSTDYAPPPAQEYTPTGGAGMYSQPQTPMSYQQPGQGEPPHPALAAVVSLFFPGMGLLFVPNKQRFGIFLFAGTILGYVLLITIYVLFSAITLGFGAFAGCCFLLLPLWNLATAVHSYDEAAKVSNGKFQPLIFK